MKIEPGKFYQTRNGLKARIYSVNCGGAYPIHGAVLRNGFWIIKCFTREGRGASAAVEDYWDIIAEWYDTPVVPWKELFPPWVKWFAVDECGAQFGYKTKPFKCNTDWISERRRDDCPVPDDLRIPITCDWTDSLVERKEGE